MASGQGQGLKSGQADHTYTAYMHLLSDAWQNMAAIMSDNSFKQNTERMRAEKTDGERRNRDMNIYHIKH
jgi:hypothetical protein